MSSADPSHTILDVEHPPTDSREARTRSPGQFWIWCGANIAPINWVLGALGVNLGPRPERHRDRPRPRQPGRDGRLRTLRPHGSAHGRHRDGDGPRGLRSSGQLPARRHPGPRGHRMVCGEHLDRPRPGDGPARQDGDRRPGRHELRLEDRRRGPRDGIQVAISWVGYRAIAAFERWTVPPTIAVLVPMSVVAWFYLDIDWGYAGPAGASSPAASARS